MNNSKYYMDSQYSSIYGYHWVAVVDAKTAQELIKYSAPNLVLVSCPRKARVAKLIGNLYNVYLKI